MVKKILLGLVGVVVLAGVVSLFLPSKWHVEKSVKVKASSEVIYASVADLKQWESWAAWNRQMDPTAKWEFTGSAIGEGAVMSWKGEKMGTGTLKLTKGDPKTGVAYEMKMESMSTPAVGTIGFKPEGAETTVTWVDDGDFGMFLPGRYFVGFMENMLGDQFQQGLDRLKANAEKAQVAADEAAAQAKAKAEADAAAAKKDEEEAAAAAAAAAASNPVKPASGKKK